MAFLNPYAWVGHAPRKAGPLSDAAPGGHDRARDGQLHGHITVTLEAVTPLLILDDSARTADKNQPDHFTYEVPLNADGSPLIALSGLKGALRQAYEAVTASRYGAFSDHTNRLGRRLPASKGAGLTPARLTTNDKGEWVAELLEGKIDDPDAKATTFVRPAFIPCSAVKQLAGLQPNDQLDTKQSYEKYMALHGCKVIVKFKAISHKNKRNGAVDFVGWRTSKIAIPQGPTVDVNDQTWNGRGQADFTAKGYLFLTGPQSAQGKHEERIFFHASDVESPALSIAFDQTARQMWRDVMKSYEDAHDLERPSDHLEFNKGAIPRTRFAAHLVQPHRRTIQEGSLIYLRLKNENGTRVIGEVHPVAIGRKLFPQSPAVLTPDDLRPLGIAAEASPADRLFGWVARDKTAQYDDQAHRGHVRFANVETSGASVDTLVEPIPLKILGAPKPQQHRFYLAKRPDCGAKLGPSTSDGFDKLDTLRGRKFYWHHVDGPSIAHKKRWSQMDRSRQNRSIKNWVATGSTIVLRLDISNAQAADLGGLLWMLTAARGADPCHLRVGYGKPFGFGSLKVTGIESSLESTADLRDRLANLRPHGPRVGQDTVIAAFLAAIGKNADTPENELPDHLREYLRIGRGIEGHDIHYPKNSDADNGYEWFMKNEKGKQHLPMTLDLDPRLKPFDPDRPQQPNRNRPNNDRNQGRPRGR